MDEIEGWTHTDIKLAKTIKKRAIALSFIYERSAGRYAKIGNILSAIIIIGTFAFGTAGIAAPLSQVIAGIKNETVAATASYSVSIALSALVTIVGLIQSYAKAQDFAGKQYKHLAASREFGDIYLTVNTYLRRRDGRRPDFADFFADICRRDTSARISGGPLPKAAIDAYYATHGTKSQPREVLFNELADLSDVENSPSLKRSAKKSMEKSQEQLHKLRHAQ